MPKRQCLPPPLSVSSISIQLIIVLRHKLDFLWCLISFDIYVHICNFFLICPCLILCLLFIAIYCSIQLMTLPILYRGVMFKIDVGGKASRHKHSKGLHHDACSSIPLISLDQIPMTTMLPEASSEKTYFDSSHLYCLATTVTLTSGRKLPA